MVSHPEMLTRAARMRREPTEPEKWLWRHLSGSKLAGLKFRRQATIGRRIVDFFFPAIGLIIEVDGPHHQTPEAIAYDAQRTGWLESQGFRVRRFTARQTVEDREAVLAAIKTDIASPPSQPFPHQGGRALFRARDQWVRDDEN